MLTMPIWQENSRIQKQILCEKFDRMSAILEERRKLMIQQITSEQEQKTGWTQYLLQTYNEHVDTNSKLIQAAQNAIEEPEMASFVQVLYLFGWGFLVILHIECQACNVWCIFFFYLSLKDLKRSYREVSLVFLANLASVRLFRTFI